MRAVDVVNPEPALLPPAGDLIGAVLLLLPKPPPLRTAEGAGAGGILDGDLGGILDGGPGAAVGALPPPPLPLPTFALP